MFSAIHGPDRARRTKTNIVRTRTGCQNCRKRRRKCDEGRPECQGCVKRGIKCSGYERPIAFKDVSNLAAESSRKFEAARWAALRAEDEQLGRKRSRVGGSPASVDRVETLSSDAGSDLDGDRSSSSSTDPPTLPKATSPRSYRRAPPSFTRQASSFFDLSDNRLPPIDQALYQSPPPTYQSSDCQNSVSFALADTPEDSPPTNPSSLIPYTNPDPTPELPLPTLITTRDSPAREASLIHHFETYVLPNLPVPMTFAPSYMENSCFRHAILALSSVNQAYLQTRTRHGHSTPAARLCRRSAVGREHYLCAVSELYRRLDPSSSSSSSSSSLAAQHHHHEQHAAAALMLAYYEIETGSPFGSARHARGLDALLSKLDHLSPGAVVGLPSAVPGIFKACRLLRYEVRYIAAPYRTSVLRTDAHDAYACLDPQLAIRDVYTLAWSLMGRVELEGSFEPSPERGSRSRQAAVWIRDVADRTCDWYNVRRGDYHLDEIESGEVVSRCERFSRALDSWHDKLGREARPAVRCGSGRPFVTSQGTGTGTGTVFEPIAVLEFAGGDGKAFEYMMYVTARLFVSYLLSVYGGGGEGPRGSSSTPAETAAWANMLFGVVCGMEHRDMTFSYVNAVNNLSQAAMLCEGVGPTNAVLEGVIPYVLGRGIPVAELAMWLYLKKGMEIVKRERIRGKSVRRMFLTFDEDYEKGLFDTRYSFVAFGDCNGRSHFRDVYTIDRE